MNVVGTTNLAARIVIQDIEPVTVGGQPYFVVRNNSGQLMGINPDGVIYWTTNPPGAWETCTKGNNLLYFKFGVVSYGEGYLN